MSSFKEREIENVGARDLDVLICQFSASSLQAFGFNLCLENYFNENYFALHRALFTHSDFHPNNL